MTEQQFTYNRCEDGFFDIIDIKNHHTYPIGDIEIFVVRIVKLLNNINNEKEELKQFKNKTFDLLDEEITKSEEAIEVFEEQGVDVGAMGFYVDMLKILRKELQ